MPHTVQYRMTRKERKANNIEDVFDGQLYNKHFGDDGFMKGASAAQKRIKYICHYRLILMVLLFSSPPNFPYGQFILL